jgi:putative Mg2+ transporter-C (MgtC) family protein
MITIDVIEPVLRLVLALVFGALVGVEREISRKPAGVRTHMLVSLGSCLFTIISLFDFSLDPARVAAGVVTGIGFIGAGSIIAEPERIVGITTAAGLWVTGAIGLAVGAGNYVLSSTTTFLIVLIFILGRARKLFIK